MSRAEVEKLVRDVYRARLSNQLEQICDYFLPESELAINGDPEASAIALRVAGKSDVEAMLAALLQRWEWLEQDIQRILIDGNQAAVQ